MEDEMIKLIAMLMLIGNVYGETDIKVMFGPKGGIEEEVWSRIKNAKTTIFVMAYDLTSEPIAKSLLEAHRRGVKVSLVVDRMRSLSPNSVVPILVSGNVLTKLDGKHRIFHNKVMVFDQKVTVTGSHNWTKGGNLNAENCVIIEDGGVANEYLKNFMLHWEHGVLQ